MFRLLPIIVLLFSISVFSQTIKVRSAGMGKARITNGKLSSIINLSKDVSGCFLLYDGSDPQSKKADVTSFGVIDSVKKGGSIYVVLLATAGGNCNVQGMCGATEDWTLVWLKLNNNLKVLDKKAIVVQSCRYGNIDLETDFEEGKRPLKLVNGSLKIEYSENKYREDEDYKFHTLTYKKAEGEKGFRVVTDKRKRPKN